MEQFLKINTILHTKDGEKVGNAIIVGIINGMYKVKTDYGNTILMDKDELTDKFKIAWIHHSDFESKQMYEQKRHKHSVSEKKKDAYNRDFVLFRELRKKSGMTQVEIAKELGLSTYVNICGFENGRLSAISNEVYNKAIDIFNNVIKGEYIY